MLKLFLILPWISLSSVFLFSQNLLPNPGFEAHTTCPNSNGDVDGYVTSWTRGNTASPDYNNCGYTGNSAIRYAPRTGTGSIGMWGGASHPSCSNSAYSEPVQANLTSTMVIGQTYDVSMAIRVDGVGSATANPNNCVDMGMYFYNSASPPPANGWCCYNVAPQWRVTGGSIPMGTYQLFSGTIIATGNYNRVIIGAFCNGTTSTGTCANYSGTRMYFNLDDVTAQPIVVLDESELNLYGKAYTEFNGLYWEFPETKTYTQLTLERSDDGQRFVTLHESNLLTGNNAFQFTDHDPLSGENYYRLTAIDENGQAFFSNMLRLANGFGQNDRENKLIYSYDQIEDQLSFSLDADQGGAFELDLIDMSGRKIKQFDWQVGPGLQDFDLRLAGIANGMYLLRLRSPSQGKVWQNKILKH